MTDDLVRTFPVGSSMPIPPGTPQWALAGADLSEQWSPKMWARGMRVMVIASPELSRAELAGFAAAFAEPDKPPEGPVYQFKALMRRVIIAYGTDFADAVRRIFNEWDPDDRPQRPAGALPAAPPAAINVASASAADLMIAVATAGSWAKHWARAGSEHTLCGRLWNQRITGPPGSELPDCTTCGQTVL